jgi:hypothetical protein
MAGMPLFLPNKSIATYEKRRKAPFWYRFAVLRLQTVVRVRVFMLPIVPAQPGSDHFFLRFDAVSGSAFLCRKWSDPSSGKTGSKVILIMFNCFNHPHNIT